MRKLIFSMFVIALSIVTFRAKAQETLIFNSDNLHCADTVLVFTPANAGSLSQNMPTVFLFHGASGRYFDWSRHMDVQALSNETGFRIICPDGFSASWYVDDVDPSKMQWRSFFWNELWPYCKKNFSLEPANTFITGLSMGGHGAMSIYLDHPEYFKGAGSMSGVLDLSYSGQAKTRLPGIFGATDIRDEKCTKNYCVNRLEAYRQSLGKETDNKMLVITCGTQDTSFLPAADAFIAKCRELGIRHIGMTSPGRHEWPYWVWAVRYHLDWFSQELK